MMLRLGIALSILSLAIPNCMMLQLGAALRPNYESVILRSLQVAADGEPEPHAPEWEVLSVAADPVLDKEHAEAEGIEDGFEGGRVLRDRHGVYHLFPTERLKTGSGVGDGPQPPNLHTRLGHWTSSTPGTRGSWARTGTIFESHHKYDASDRRSSMF